jgi:hypothetical protein
VSDQKQFSDALMLSFALLELYCMCVRDYRDVIISVDSRIARRGGGGGAISLKMGQLTCSMGLDWMGVHTRASKATTPSKGFCI